MGRYKLIASPEEMWQHFTDYRTSVKKRPIIVKDWVGKDADKVEREKERPLTIEGFENYCFENNIIADLGHYFANTDNAYEEFRTICSHIRKNIRQDQIEGGMAGIYNPSITQRLNGLVEKSAADDTRQITINVKHGDRHNTKQPTREPREGSAGEETV